MKLLVCITALAFVLAGCAGTRPCLTTSEYVASLLEAMRSECFDDTGAEPEARVRLQGLAGTGVVESQLLVAGEAFQGDRLCHLLGWLGNQASIPAILNYSFRRDVLEDVKNVEKVPVGGIQTESESVSLEDVPVDPIYGIYAELRMMTDEEHDDVFVQLRICYPLYQRWPWAQAMILWIASELCPDKSIGLAGTAVDEMIWMGLSSSNRRVAEEALELFSRSYPRVESVDRVVAFIEEGKFPELLATARAHVALFLPDGGPYAGLDEAQYQTWVENEMVNWWKANRESIKYDSEEGCLKMKNN